MNYEGIQKLGHIRNIEQDESKVIYTKAMGRGGRGGGRGGDFLWRDRLILWMPV